MSRAILFTLMLLPILVAAHEPLTKTKAKQFSQQHSLYFIENKGQIKDQYGKARNDIDFKLSAGKGLNVFIGREGLHYQWAQDASPRPSPKEREVLLNKTDSKGSGDFSFRRNDDPGVTEKCTIDMYRMDVELVGAKKDAEFVVEEEQEYYETYYTAPFSPYKGGIVHSYKKITYKNIYPGIDWVLHPTPALSINGEGGKLEYDFVVHEGGNVKDIKMKYGGTTNLMQNANKGIAALTPMGSISEKAPYSYEQESEGIVASSFVLENNILSFETEAYGGTLVIDPVLEWATYYGGSGNIETGSIVCDAYNNVYMTGPTNSSSNIASIGSYQDTLNGNSDAYIVKFNAAGQRIWGTYYGGPGDDRSIGITFAPATYLYIGGLTSSSSNIATSGAYQGTYGGGKYDAFLAKFDTSGGLVWATYFGDTALDVANAVSCDASGNVYMSGYTRSAQNIATTGAFQTSYGGSTTPYSSAGGDGFLAKFNVSGSRQWCTYYGGSKDDNALSVRCFGPYVYLSGATSSSNNIASAGAFLTSPQQNNGSGFLAQFNSSGNRLWGTYCGGGIFGSNCDTNGNIYITGEADSAGTMATVGAFQLSGISNSGLLMKFNSGGQPIWCTYYGGLVASPNGNCIGRSVKCGADNNVIMEGRVCTAATNVFSAGAYQAIYGGGGYDVFIAKFSATGRRLWGTYYGGSNFDDSQTNDGISIDVGRNVYISGNSNSNNGIATANAYQTTLNGNGDAFLAKWGPDTFMIAQPYTDTLLCAGDSFSLNFIYNLTFAAYNDTFTVQLSDAGGSFASPVNIGTTIASTGGSILCSIPLNTANGAGYRIRIVSKNPIDTSKDDGINMHIKAIPAHSASYNNPLCTGDTLKLRDTAVSCNIYRWSGPNSFSSVQHNPIIPNVIYADSGKYYVTDTFMNGCHAMDSVDVMVNAKPAVPIAGSNSPICAGDSLKLHATDSTTGVSWQWMGANSFSSVIQNPVRVNAPLADSGKYIVKASLNGCSSKPDTIQVVINATVTPTVSISSLPAVIVPGNMDTFTATVSSSCDSPAYQWYINGVKITGATGSVFHANLSNGDHISVRVHCGGACLSPDSAVSNSLTTGISSWQLAVSSVKIYPNPNNGSLTLSLSEGEGKSRDGIVSIYITNTIGQVVYKNIATIQNNHLQEQINLNVPIGVYILRVRTDEGNSVLRFVIE